MGKLYLNFCTDNPLTEMDSLSRRPPTHPLLMPDDRVGAAPCEVEPEPKPEPDFKQTQEPALEVELAQI